MKLQRQFAKGVDQPCTHVRVVHTGTTPEQNFSDRLVAAGYKVLEIPMEAECRALDADPKRLLRVEADPTDAALHHVGDLVALDVFLRDLLVHVGPCAWVAPGGNRTPI